MTEDRPVVRCTGRAHDDRGHGVGEPCTFVARADRGETLAALLLRARVAGWAIGDDGNAMCPRCRRPDPRATAAIASFGSRP